MVRRDLESLASFVVSWERLPFKAGIKTCMPRSFKTRELKPEPWLRSPPLFFFKGAGAEPELNFFKF